LGVAATTAETMSATFANNFASSTLVRSGPLTIPANSFTLGSSPNAFGPVISFNQNGNAYTYTGGDLVIEIRTPGTSSTTPAVDADATPAKGFGTAAGSTYNSVFAADSTATSGSQFVAPIIQLSVTPVPEPTTWGMAAGISLGAFAMARRFRQS
jgi:hypothetical protein